jgi:hypothetical protein
MSFGCVYSEKEERIMNMCYARHTLHDFVGAVNTAIAEILLRAWKPSDESMKAMKNFKLSALEAIGNAHLLTGWQDECMIELDDLEKKMKQKSEQYLFYRLLGVIFQKKRNNHWSWKGNSENSGAAPLPRAFFVSTFSSFWLWYHGR